MKRRIPGIVAVVLCIVLLFPMSASAMETCYIRFSRLSVNELSSSEKSFEMPYSATSYLKRLEADQGEDTHYSVSISGSKLCIRVTSSELKSMKPYGLCSSLNRPTTAKKGVADRRVSLSGLKRGFYSAGIRASYKDGTTDRLDFYLRKSADGCVLYSPGRYYNDQLIDSAEAWYTAVGREAVNAAYTANADPKIAERAAQLTALKPDDAGKAEAIYSWIIENFRYDYEYSIYDPVICFRENRGVCNAIAQLYTIMCNSVGVPCLLVYGESIDGSLTTEKTDTVQNHAWVLVYTDGQWRYCDPTWDLGSQGSEDYYMVSGTQAGTDHIAYSAFIPDPTSNTAFFFHEWGKCTVEREATETEDGRAVYTCTKCGNTKTVVIPARKKNR